MRFEIHEKYRCLLDVKSHIPTLEEFNSKLIDKMPKDL